MSTPIRETSLRQNYTESSLNTPPTPIRKRPQEHHCMAEKKTQIFRVLSVDQTSYNTKKLFNENEYDGQQQMGRNIATRNLRS